jgi:hypothetical protein
MKSIFYLLLGLMKGAAADAQGLPKSASALLQWKLQITGPPPLSISGLLQSRVMKPDHMSCLIPDVAKVERMPVCRSANADPMPNGFHLNGPRRIYVMPGHPFYVKPGDK